jgi:tRNA threonylcarbamoyl adenosine modification protein YeaZ
MSVTLQSGERRYSCSRDIGLKHSETLVPSARSLAAEAGISLRDLEAVAVTIGPGSFTGLRIGLATAKGFAEGADCTLFGAPTLAVILSRYDWVRMPIIAVLDARKRRYYVAGRKAAGGDLGPSDLSPADAFEALGSPEQVLVTGPHAEAFRSELSDALGDSGSKLFADQRREGLAPRLCDLLLSGNGFIRELAPDEGPFYIRDNQADE